MLLTTQFDGNLVLYNSNLFRQNPNGASAALWASGSYGLENGPALYPTYTVQPVCTLLPGRALAPCA